MDAETWDTLRRIVIFVLIFGGFFAYLDAMFKNTFLQILTVLLIGSVCGWLVQTFYYEEQMLKSVEIVPAKVTDMKQIRKKRGTRLTIYLIYESPFDGTIQTDDAHIRSIKAYEEIAVGDIVNLMVSIEDPSVTLLERQYPPSRVQFYTFIILSVFFIGTGVDEIWAKVIEWRQSST